MSDADGFQVPTTPVAPGPRPTAVAGHRGACRRPRRRHRAGAAELQADLVRVTPTVGPTVPLVAIEPVATALPLLEWFSGPETPLRDVLVEGRSVRWLRLVSARLLDGSLAEPGRDLLLRAARGGTLCLCWQGSRFESGDRAAWPWCGWTATSTSSRGRRSSWPIGLDPDGRRAVRPRSPSSHRPTGGSPTWPWPPGPRRDGRSASRSSIWRARRSSARSISSPARRRTSRRPVRSRCRSCASRRMAATHWSWRRSDRRRRWAPAPRRRDAWIVDLDGAVTGIRVGRGRRRRSVQPMSARGSTSSRRTSWRRAARRRVSTRLSRSRSVGAASTGAIWAPSRCRHASSAVTDALLDADEGHRLHLGPDRPPPLGRGPA